MCGGAAIVHPQGKIGNIYSWQIGRDKEFLSLNCENMDWESPPSVLVTKNLNWSLEIGYGDWLRKGKVLAPQLCPT